MRMTHSLKNNNHTYKKTEGKKTAFQKGSFYGIKFPAYIFMLESVF